MFSNEYEYLSLVKNVITNGNLRSNRTDTNTLSIFGEKMVFNLENYKIPLLTTKKMNWYAIKEELFWFIKGYTNAKILSDKNVKIWNYNADKTGELGPIYGFQWRHFGAKYINKDANYNNQGVDQLMQIINLIKNDPNSRRIIMSAWNPIDNDKMALPPCHCFIQFYVHNNQLSSQMYQRSGDIGLGIPFNIASYSLLTHLIAHITNLTAKEFIHIIGDAHIYDTHINQLKLQLNRHPLSEPYIELDKNIIDIEDFTSENIKLHNYKHYPYLNLPFIL